MDQAPTAQHAHRILGPISTEVALPLIRPLLLQASTHVLQAIHEQRHQLRDLCLALLQLGQWERRNTRAIKQRLLHAGFAIFGLELDLAAAWAWAWMQQWSVGAVRCARIDKNMKVNQLVSRREPPCLHTCAALRSSSLLCNSSCKPTICASSARDFSCQAISMPANSCPSAAVRSATARFMHEATGRRTCLSVTVAIR